MEEKKDEIEYKHKLNKSYKICIEELKNPKINWEDDVTETKFTIDHLTQQPKTFHIFILDFKDNINVQNHNHTYIFRRSHFYQKFHLPYNRLRQELTQYYNQKGYFVNLFKDMTIHRWCLKLEWDSSNTPVSQIIPR